jgi:peptide deformylase
VSVRTLVKVGDPGDGILHDVQLPELDVTTPDAFEIAAALIEYLNQNGLAAGIAAPQLGLRARAYAYRSRNEGVTVIWNPTLELRGRVEPKRERCLSLDRAYLTPRHTVAIVSALDVSGEPIVLESHGFEARIHQHEYDHLNGRLIGAH